MAGQSGKRQYAANRSALSTLRNVHFAVSLVALVSTAYNTLYATAPSQGNLRGFVFVHVLNYLAYAWLAKLSASADLTSDLIPSLLIDSVYIGCFVLLLGDYFPWLWHAYWLVPIFGAYLIYNSFVRPILSALFGWGSSASSISTPTSGTSRKTSQTSSYSDSFYSDFDSAPPRPPTKAKGARNRK